MANKDLTRRDHGVTFDLETTEDHEFNLQPFNGFVLEVEDEHFHHDSAVLLPNYEAVQRKIDTSLGLSVLAACLKHENANPKQTVLITGHADTSGADQYNLEISAKRAQAVLHAIMGERDAWVEISLGKHKTEDYQLILTWVADMFGWDCDPQGVDNVDGPHTKKAVKNFQTIYNREFEANIATSGTVDRDTWGAIFDVYMDALASLCETDADGLTKLRSGMNFLGPKVVGCGENWPIEAPQRQNYRSRINRRVEILFFDPGQEPKLDCHPDGGQCTPLLCELYNLKMYRFTPLPVVPSPLMLRQVFLKLTYLGPEKEEHVFPPEFPVTVLWADGSEHVEKVQANGLLEFGVPQNQGTCALLFDTEDTYIATAASGSSDANPDRTAHAAAVKTLHQGNFRFFKVPDAWSLQHSDWKTDQAPHFDSTNFLFNLPSGRLGKTLGTSGSPEPLQLDPHWTFVRFEFFDRFFGHSSHAHKRINIPATLIDGWLTSDTDDDPDTRSHWTINETDPAKSVHAVPWILQFSETHEAQPKPDKDVQLGFDTDKATFVISDSATSRKIDVITDAKKLEPGVDRLKLYDLPTKWRSEKYYTRFSDGKGEFFDKASTFEDKIKNSNNSAAPLTFSLDDIVLTDGTSYINLAATELVTLFYNEFRAPSAGFVDKPVSPYGMYNPGKDLGKPYYPYSDLTIASKTPGYLTEYPNWVRLVIAQGNLFDVFSERTKNEGDIVGARAAQLWIAGNGGSIPQPPAPIPSRPGHLDVPAAGPHYSHIQPLFEQQRDPSRSQRRSPGIYQGWNAASGSPSHGTGRCDMALLRCCGVENHKEIAISFHYFRFSLDFTSPPKEVNTQALQQQYKQRIMDQIPVRWIGPDPKGNPKGSVFRPDDASVPLEIRVDWFCQELPLAQAQFQVKVLQDVRAFMGWHKGNAQADQNDATIESDGAFTLAHECGHSDGLIDEYIETRLLASYHAQGFAAWIPGDPYSLDKTAIMNGNIEVRPRHLWHTVEWIRDCTKIDFHIDTDGAKYKLPHHPTPAPVHVFVNWPWYSEIGQTGPGAGLQHVGARGAFDLHLFTLCNESKLKRDKTFDGILLIDVRIYAQFDDPKVKFDDIESALNDMVDKIAGEFNLKYKASGDVGGLHFNNCLVHFHPRFLVPTFTSDHAKYFEELDLPIPKTEPARANYIKNTAPTDYANLVSTTRTDFPEHFIMRVRDSYTAQWSSAAPGNQLAFDSGKKIKKFFGDMIGLDMTTGGDNNKQAVLTRIVSRALSKASVDEL